MSLQQPRISVESIIAQLRPNIRFIQIGNVTVKINVVETSTSINYFLIIKQTTIEIMSNDELEFCLSLDDTILKLPRDIKLDVIAELDRRNEKIKKYNEMLIRREKKFGKEFKGSPERRKSVTHENKEHANTPITKDVTQNTTNMSLIARETLTPKRSLPVPSQSLDNLQSNSISNLIPQISLQSDNQLSSSSLQQSSSSSVKQLPVHANKKTIKRNKIWKKNMHASGFYSGAPIKMFLSDGSFIWATLLFIDNPEYQRNDGGPEMLTLLHVDEQTGQILQTRAPVSFVLQQNPTVCSLCSPLLSFPSKTDYNPTAVRSMLLRKKEEHLRHVANENDVSNVTNQFEACSFEQTTINSQPHSDMIHEDKDPYNDPDVDVDFANLLRTLAEVIPTAMPNPYENYVPATSDMPSSSTTKPIPVANCNDTSSISDMPSTSKDKPIPLSKDWGPKKAVCNFCNKQLNNEDKLRHIAQCPEYFKIHGKYMIAEENIDYSQKDANVTFMDTVEFAESLLEFVESYEKNAELPTSESYALAFIVKEHKDMNVLGNAWLNDLRTNANTHASWEFAKQALKNVDEITDPYVRTRMQKKFMSFYDGIFSNLDDNNKIIDGFKRRMYQHFSGAVHVSPMMFIGRKEQALLLTIVDQIKEIWKMSFAELFEYSKTHPNIIVYRIKNLKPSIAELFEIGKQIARNKYFQANDQMTNIIKYKACGINNLRKLGCMVIELEAQQEGEQLSLFEFLQEPKIMWEIQSKHIQRLSKFNNCPDYVGINWRMVGKMEDMAKFYMAEGACHEMLRSSDGIKRMYNKRGSKLLKIYSLNYCFEIFAKQSGVTHVTLPRQMSVANIRDQRKIVEDTSYEEVPTLIGSNSEGDIELILECHTSYKFKQRVKEEKIIFATNRADTEDFCEQMNTYFNGAVVADGKKIFCPFCKFFVDIKQGRISSLLEHVKRHHCDEHGHLYTEKCHFCSCPIKRNGLVLHENLCRRSNWKLIMKGLPVFKMPVVTKGQKWDWTFQGDVHVIQNKRKKNE